MSFFDKATKEKAEMTPEEGFNLVGLDTYGAPDEQGLYLIAHFDTRQEADTERAKRIAANPGGTYFVYGKGN